jgi:hypothetical protein
MLDCLQWLCDDDGVPPSTCLLQPLTTEQLVHAATQRRSYEAAHASSSSSNVLAAKNAAGDELRITVGAAGGSSVLGKIAATGVYVRACVCECVCVLFTVL